MAKVHRLQDDLFNKPHLATPQTLDGILNYLTARNNGEFELKTSQSSFASSSDVEFDPSTKIGTLRIMGPLSYRSTILTSLCNLTSYQKIEVDFRKLIALGAKQVVLLIDSGGGEAYSCFETAALIRNLADQNSVRLVGYCDGLAASAAYAFASVCHELIVNPQSEIGSIGVVIKLRNINKGLQKAGIEDTYLFGGSEKVPFDKSGDWSASFIADLQGKIDSLYSEFTAFIAKHRKMSIKDVVATNAKTFLAKDAIDIGLADQMMTREDFNKYLVSGKSLSKPVNASIVPINAEASSQQKSTARPIAKKKSNLTSEDRIVRISKIFKTWGDIQFVHDKTKSLSDIQFENKLREFERNLGIKTKHG